MKRADLNKKVNKLGPIGKYLLIAMGGYLLANVLIFFLADQYIYQPPRPSLYTDNEQTLKLSVPLKEGPNKISAVYLSNPGAKYTILYLHGNAADLSGTMPILNYFHSHGFSVMSIDYPGYGTSEGIPSEDSLYQSAEEAFHYLVNTQKIPAKQIIIYGKSLGAAVALQLAIEEPSAGLIMDSAFLSAFRTVSHTRWQPLLFDRYINSKKINKITIPVLFIASSSDQTVSPFHTQTLYEEAPSALKSIYWVPNADHNNLLMVAGKEFWTRLDQFIKENIERHLGS